MKHVLIVKMSSLGDVIHTLPALTDAMHALPGIQFDWVVEENFSEIPHWHPAVKRVIPVAVRHWRKHLFNTIVSGKWQAFRRQLQTEHYDAVIDAQGLIKSAVITRKARGRSFGLDRQSARESFAARFYQNPLCIAKDQHAVERVRQLFARVLDYPVPATLDYGIKEVIQQQVIAQGNNHKLLENRFKPVRNIKYILFFHATTWASKHWPEPYWIELANRLGAEGFHILVPWGDDKEHQRALRIQQQSTDANIKVLPKMNLNELAQLLLNVSGVIAVDTGLAHLSAALSIPTVALFGPTNPGLTGTYGNNQLHLLAVYSCSPCLKKHCDLKLANINQKDTIQPACFSTLPPKRVQQALSDLIAK